jgi:hypothetical protein
MKKQDKKYLAKKGEPKTPSKTDWLLGLAGLLGGLGTFLLGIAALITAIK